jgi:micrococcal nuclease
VSKTRTYKSYTRKPKKAIASLISLVALAVLALGWNFLSPLFEDGSVPDGLESVRVVRVVDGDTIVVSRDGSEERVRFIGVDTPESVHPDASKNVPYGKVASAYTKDRLEGKTVGLEFDVEERDRYGRLLAYVYIDEEMFNEELVRKGHAMIATYPPNVKYVERFTQAQEKAREEGLGLWA